MASTYTVNLGIEKPATGDQAGSWGTTANTSYDLIDEAVNGIVSVTLAAAGTSGAPNDLPITNGASSNGRNAYISITDGGDLGADVFVQLTPNDAEKIAYIQNNLTGSRDLFVFQGTYSASRDYVVGPGQTRLLKFSGAGAASSTVTEVMQSVREVLTAARTYYVRADGADTNNGLVNSAIGAFLTIQKAVDVVATLDFNGKVVTIQVGAGTYTDGVNVTGLNVGQISEQYYIIKGDTATPANVIISATSDDCFTVDSGAQVSIQGFELRTITSGHHVTALSNSIAELKNITFAACAGRNIRSQINSHVLLAASYTISASPTSGYHVYCDNRSRVTYSATFTATLSGTPAFSNYFIYCSDLSTVTFTSGTTITWSGSATGARYNSVRNSLIQTNGQATTWLPGNAVGSTNTGGIYA